MLLDRPHRTLIPTFSLKGRRSASSSVSIIVRRQKSCSVADIRRSVFVLDKPLPERFRVSIAKRNVRLFAMARPLRAGPSPDKAKIAFARKRRAHELVRSASEFAVAEDRDFARAANRARLYRRHDAFVLPMSDVACVVVVPREWIGQ